jgi:dGTPase
MVTYSAADAERLTPEAGKAGDSREPWEIDRARILHSAAFRRLQRKTQVFAPGEGDFFRTRLTHSLEVSQIAKGIAIRVGANPTLCEAASLAHDIGHPPFGHSGERVLNECMAQAGGFEGNAQNLRVLAALEIKSDAYPGLNLTRATLDALLKYKRSHSEARARGEDKFFYDEELPLVDWVCRGDRDERTSFECQIMEWADDVAYSVHDVEDGMWAEVIALDRLRALSATSGEMEAVLRELSAVLAVSGERQRKAAQKTWSSFAIYELVTAATASAVGDGGRGARYAWQLHVEPAAVVKSRILKGIAQELLFGDPRVAAVAPRASKIVGGLFEALMARPELIPGDFASGDRRRDACDYISGMTDDYAEASYLKLSGA